MVRLLNSFTLLCKNYNPHNKFVWDTSICICDFRINIHECPEQEILKIINWVLIAYCLLLTIVSSICLYHLIYVKKQPFFLPARKDRGILRPRPQHMYYALALIYCPCKYCKVLYAYMLCVNLIIQYIHLILYRANHSYTSTC